MEVLLFGILAEKAGSDRLQLQVRSIHELKNELSRRIQDLDRYTYAIAVDRKIVQDDRQLLGTEEIAILPPFAGG
jgi:molybdopterin converting factor small subunit